MLFDMLRAAFDVVLLDVGPMAGDAELDDMASCAAAANVGGAYLVFDSRNTSNIDMTATAERLRHRGIDVWGAIENFHH
jgi:Mrp family chromosome partitioning ATPase